MNTAKDEVKTLLSNLPEDCTLEDVQYHLYVFEKIHKGLERADNEGTQSQKEIEKEFNQWTTS